MSNIVRNQTFFHRHLKMFVLLMMLINRSEMFFLGKTDQSQIDFVLYNVLLTTPVPHLAKRHIQIHVKQQIKHENPVFGHRMATGPTPWGLLYTFQDIGLKPPSTSLFILLCAVLEV